MIQRLLRILTSRVEVPVFAKRVSSPVRPVQLVQVDGFSLQAPQAALEADTNLVRTDSRGLRLRPCWPE